MKKHFLRASCTMIVVMFVFQCVSAQTDPKTAAAQAAMDKYVISAKAGGVNYTEGGVTITRANGTDSVLTRHDEIAVGERVSTAPDGRAEILLNPGSYLRLASNSAFDFKSTALDNLQIKLYNGSAIFEVFANHEFKIRVVTPNAKMLLIETGVFRVDVLPDGSARVAVWDGSALLGDNQVTLLRKGQTAMIKNGTATVAKLSGGDKDDEFAVWSKSRGKELAKESAKLKNAAVANLLRTSFQGGLWNLYGSFGLWVFNPMFGSYCFLPFGDDWDSPYGFGYGNCLCHYPGYYQYWYAPPPPAVSGGGGGPPPSPTITPIATAGDRKPVPPFERLGGGAMGRGGLGGGNTGSGRQSGNSGSSGSSSPSYSPPVYVAPAPAPASAPAAATTTRAASEPRKP